VSVKKRSKRITIAAMATALVVAAGVGGNSVVRRQVAHSEAHQAMLADVAAGRRLPDTYEHTPKAPFDVCRLLVVEDVAALTGQHSSGNGGGRNQCYYAAGAPTYRRVELQVWVLQEPTSALAIAERQHNRALVAQTQHGGEAGVAGSPNTFSYQLCAPNVKRLGVQSGRYFIEVYATSETQVATNCAASMAAITQRMAQRTPTQ
jgi:hypothetical protein